MDCGHYWEAYPISWILIGLFLLWLKIR